jgi:mRNA-degrading endonuclease RelE of RelBE toxin-antitoxin system
MFTVYGIEFTPEALEDLRALRKFEQKEVLDRIESQLRHEPTVEARNRKKLRPNAVAEWELRIGRFRVLYNVEEDVRVVSIEAIGFKVGNQLFVHGKEAEL